MSPAARDRTIVALDLPAREAFPLAEAIRDEVRWVKVGMTLFYSEGPGCVARLRALGFDVFVDLKLHDIPHQARGAAEALGTLGAGMLTVHGTGGRAMLRAAAEGARLGAEAEGHPHPSVLVVTVLTSLDVGDLSETGISGTPELQVRRLAALAADSGCDGVVCSPGEATAVRPLLHPAALVVTPGVRPQGGEAGDQSRIATPRSAVDAGASHIVVGRPVTSASDPVSALRRIIDELDGEEV